MNTAVESGGVAPGDGASRSGAGEALEGMVLWLLAHFGTPMSAPALRARAARLPGPWTLDEAVEALESFGIRCREDAAPGLPGLLADLPCLLVGEGRAAALVTGTDKEGRPLLFEAGAPRPRPAGDGELEALRGDRRLVFSPPLRLPSADGAPRGRYGHWFWGPLLASRPLYLQVGFAALLTNLFALAASVFSMIVYDRVMPNSAFETLTALLIGVGIILASDFAIRMLRAYFLDVAGARADLAIADAIFDHVMDLELRARRGSVGSMATVMREFETVRDFFTSTTLTTLIDLPFAILFLVVIGFIGGPLVWVPLLAIPLLVGVSVAIQPSLRRLVQASYEDGLTKQSVVVEALHGLETLKSIGAASVMRRRWQDAIGHQAELGLRTRFLSQIAANTANFASQAVWVGTVTVGVFLVQDGKIGTGAIVACSMLAGRVVAPLSQLVQLLTRLNQTLSSYRALDSLMREPREHRENEGFVARGRLGGDVELRDVHFRYPGQQQGGLEGVSFKVAAGERVAILGRIGSGKTTIAKLILGLYRPDKGAVLVDGTDVRQIDPAELRANVGSVLQEVWLMSGTVKQNIALGADQPTDEAILRASAIAGVHDFVAPHPEGYGLRLRERGEGLSGGQRQAICLARALVSDPPVLLLDEPTSAMDAAGERALIERMKAAVEGRTLVLVTHRSSLLELVDRVIVVEGGKVVAQGPKDIVLKPQAAMRAPTTA